jgi:microcin C transport system permease protein
MIARLIKNPIAKKRFARLQEMKRAYISLWILIILYAISLCSELLCNDTPLFIMYQGKAYFPIFKFYPEDTFTGSGKKTRPDYHKIKQLDAFGENSGNYMLFPWIPFGPYRSIDPESIEISDNVSVVFHPMPMVGTINVNRDYLIKRSNAFGAFVGMNDRDIRGLKLTQFFELPTDIRAAIAKRFENRRAEAKAANIQGPGGNTFICSLSTFAPRSRAPTTVRLTFRESQAVGRHKEISKVEFDQQLNIVSTHSTSQSKDTWSRLPQKDRQQLQNLVKSRFLGPVDTQRLKIDGRNYRIEFLKEDVRFPFPPTKGHYMGIDSAGRDVFSRILYGLRTSMTFGLLLVFASMALGIMTGALQGYYGGILDISGQRLIEIWSALPFLYIMILMGSVYGRSFPLLLFCYGLFNWIGISYYIRAEFLRLRRQPFVEAGKCMGISAFKIIFRHILPNGLVPVITFFPFSLVGAIGSLAALDYLGFGLPPPTPSWGELLFQAQQYRWAWWLILYPSLALFFVMLLGVFVGEGIRNAYDPKRYTRLE